MVSFTARSVRTGRRLKKSFFDGGRDFHLLLLCNGGRKNNVFFHSKHLPRGRELHRYTFLFEFGSELRNLELRVHFQFSFLLSSSRFPSALRATSVGEITTVDKKK